VWQGAKYSIELVNMRNITYTVSEIRFVNITTYAKMCGIKRTSVYDRLKSGKLEASKFCEGSMIDLLEYPPCRYKSIRCKVLPPAIERDLPDWCYD